MNNIQTIYPYMLKNTWVFDDARNSLKEEAFVLGMTEVISELVYNKNIPNAVDGFQLMFSDKPFDGCDVVMEAGEPMSGGTWYSGDIYGTTMVGWLCPALFLYYKTAPKYIYVKADELPENINPIWDCEDATTIQYMAP